MNRGVPFGTALQAFSRAVGQGERAPIDERRDGRPELPDADSSNLSGWLQNFGARFRNTSDVPHEAPTYNPGMERYATETMFPDSGTAGFRPDPTPEEQAANRAAIAQFGRDVFFGPERGSWIPGLGDASRLERFARDWGVSEQEFRLSAERFQEGRLGAGVGWGGLGIAAAVPVVGQAGRGLVKGGRAVAKAAGKADDVAAAARAIPDQPLSSAIPEGHVRLVHQTDASADSLRSSGISLDEARGIEGPSGVYAVEPEAGRGFYGEIENFGGVTVEFSIPAEEWARSGGVLNRSIRPDEIIAVHEPWHFHARRMSEGDVLSEIRSGELTREYFASLGDDWVRAYDHVVSQQDALSMTSGSRVAQSQRETDPLLKQMDDLWHSEAQTDWLYAFGDVSEAEEVGRALAGGRMVTVPNRYDDLFRQLDDQFPNLQEFAGRFVDDFTEVYEYRMMLQEAMAAGGRLPENERMWSLWAALSAMEVAPPTRSVAYRAMRVTPDEAAQWQRGADVDLPVSSFSYNQGEVWQYFDPTGGQGHLPTNVMFVLEPGARALPMGAITSETAGYGPAVIGEITTAGTFRITNVQRVSPPEGTLGGWERTAVGGDYLEVTVQQIAPFTIEEVGQEVFVRSALGEGSTLASAPGRAAYEVAQAARPVRQNILEDVSLELTLEGGMNYTLPAERLAAVPEQRRVFAEIVHRQGFDGPPQTVPQNEFRRMMGDENNIVLFRGIRGGEATRGADRGRMVDAEQAAFDFISGDFYPSGGTAGSGAYFTTDGSYAVTYATGGGGSGASTQPGSVIAAVLSKNARIFDYRTAGREFYSEMRAAGFDDLGAYLAAQNYDAIRFGGWYEPTLDIAVLNRTALTVIEEPLMYARQGEAPMRSQRLGGGNFPQ